MNGNRTTEQCREPERRSRAVWKWTIYRRRSVTADVLSMDVAMRKSGFPFVMLALLTFQVGCETKVEGYGVGNGRQLQTPGLKEEIRKLKAERLKSRTMSDGN